MAQGFEHGGNRLEFAKLRIIPVAPYDRRRIAIDEALLRRLAGDKTYARGHDYARRDAVTIDGSLNDGVVASVAGSEDYCVTQHVRGGDLRGECDCPIGDNFCKHKVAAALVRSGLVSGDDDDAAEIAGATKLRAKSSPTKRGGRKTESDESALAAWLAAEKPDALRRLVLEFAGHDRNLWKQLVVRARSDPAQWKSAIGALIGRRRFRDYREGRPMHASWTRSSRSSTTRCGARPSKR